MSAIIGFMASEGSLHTNISDVALIFEGGGMRASYTAAVACALLEQGFFFRDVYGISAGAVHAVNYLSQDIARIRYCFVELLRKRGVAGLGPLLGGKGYFNAHYAYEVAGMPDGPMPFNYNAFMANPAEMHIEAYDRSADVTISWTKADISSLSALMRRVRASSTMPLLMPPVRIDGHVYLDGGLGDSWGICLEAARRDGYKRFFVVCTQERGYRKQPDAHAWLTKLLFARHPQVARRQLDRWQHYNALYEELDALERAGAAYVFHPEQMSIKSTTIDANILAQSFADGQAQAQRELPLWRGFLAV